MGLTLEDRGEYRAAEERLVGSLAAPAENQPFADYHEVGLAYLGLGRVYRGQWERPNLDLAQSYAHRGLEFYERMAAKEPVRLAIAHNTYGDLLLELGRVRESRLEFDKALQWALSSNPPNRYYEAQARLRRCLALLAESRDEQSRLLSNSR